MDRIHSEIRKISIGTDLKNAMNYVCNTKIGDMTITRIEEYEYDSFFFDTKSYVVYVTKDGINDEVWKRFDRMSVTIEYKL